MNVKAGGTYSCKRLICEFLPCVVSLMKVIYVTTSMSHISCSIFILAQFPENKITYRATIFVVVFLKIEIIMKFVMEIVLQGVIRNGILGEDDAGSKHF
jgi:hypothetical protein